MDNSVQIKDSTSWIFFVKACFATAVTAMGTGIAFLPCDLWVKGYMAMGSLFMIGASISLSKTLRDEHESRRLINKINNIKTEKLIKEYDKEL